jgi:MFS family permease
MATIIAAIAAVAFYQYLGYFSWLILVFIFGSALFTFAIVRQTMVFEVAPVKHRALLLSTSGMLVALGTSLGAMMMKFIDHDTITPHVIASVFYLLSTIPMFFVSGISSKIRKNKKIGLLRYIKNSPKIMLGGFSFNFVNASVSSFLVIYGIKSGMSISQASVLLSVLLLGTVFSIPMGFLTDKINRRFLMLFCTIFSLIFAILIPFCRDLQLTSAFLFLMFGFSIGIKLPALILINEKYKPTQRLAVNSAFNRMCLIGSICGILITGLIMKIFGPIGLWISVIFTLSSYLLFTIFNYSQKIANKEPIIGDFFVKYVS